MTLSVSAAPSLHAVAAPAPPTAPLAPDIISVSTIAPAAADRAAPIADEQFVVVHVANPHIEQSHFGKAAFTPPIAPAPSEADTSDETDLLTMDPLELEAALKKVVDKEAATDKNKDDGTK